MTNNPWNNVPVIICPDIVYNFLEDINPPESVEHLLCIYNQIEVKGALYVLAHEQNKTSIPEEEFSNHVAEWLKIKQRGPRADILSKSNKQAKSKALNTKLNQTKTMSMSEMEAVENIMSLTESERWELYRLWVDLWKTPFKREIEQHIVHLNKQAAQLNAIREEESFAVLRGADVIGMTTTGAAKYRSIINRLPVKVVIV
uniref:Uncharacterized protein n=3 Tax=Ciona intestinalis TaxID=7719 RepID=H2Y156_CIOIN